LAKRVCEHYGVRPVNEDISESLAGFDCYGRRDRAIARLIPGYDAAKGYKSKIVLPDNLLQEGGLNIFSLVVVDPKGKETKVRLPVKELREITAASNIKQRTRMTMLYYHAELRNYAVVGTANKNEHDLGFFVKYGDGGADMKPIAHLFKTQVYQLAENLDVPEEIRTREPATDTYSAGGSQQEFFFRVPFEVLDAVWYGFELGIPNQIIADGLDLSVLQVERVINDILRKQKTTAYLRTLAQGLD
jgi:NAD+ synthase